MWGAMEHAVWSSLLRFTRVDLQAMLEGAKQLPTAPARSGPPPRVYARVYYRVLYAQERLTV